MIMKRITSKGSDDQLRSDMEWSHINYEHNDGTDNNPELPKESHSSRSQNMQQNEYKAWGIPGSSHTNPRQQTYSIKWPSNINIYTVIDNNVHMFLFFIIFFLFFYFYFYISIHALNATKKSPKMTSKKDNILSNVNVTWTLSDDVTFSN